VGAGYNAQAVCTEDQIVIAAEVTIDSPDFGHLEPDGLANRVGDLAVSGAQLSREPSKNDETLRFAGLPDIPLRGFEPRFPP
jgi:hypothetical protein